MSDFTSALYLDLTYANFSGFASLSLTNGKPSVLQEPKLNNWVAKQVAKMQGIQEGLLYPSSLHTFFDFVNVLPPNAIVFIDENLYPIGKWGLERAKSFGVLLLTFTNVEDLSYKLLRLKPIGKEVWVACNGWNIETQSHSPITKYQQLLAPYEGKILIDDTQCFGLLGENPSLQMPFGFNGGGILKYLGITDTNNILTIVSLSKSYGIPISVLSANSAMIEQLKEQSDVRLHCSPVSNWYVMLANIALKEQGYLNKQRLKLYQNICLFRSMMKHLGFSLKNTLFPVQTLRFDSKEEANYYQEHFFKMGISCLRTTRNELSFCIRAGHSVNDFRVFQQLNRFEYQSLNHFLR